MRLADGAVDRSRRHHHHRNEPAINDDAKHHIVQPHYAESHVDNHGAVYYDQQPAEPIDAFDRAIDDYLDPAVFNKRSGPEFTAAVRAVFDAAAAILDVGVDSAGDRVSGPADNTPQRLHDGDLWQLLADTLFADRTISTNRYRSLRDAITTRYGNH